jgi:hypothetical protein
MNKTIFKLKGKTVGRLNHRRPDLHSIVTNLLTKGVYCKIDRICEYEFDTHVFISVVKSARQRFHVLDIAEQFDAVLKENRAKLPVFKIDCNAS